MNLFGFVWPELTANNAKIVRDFVVSDHPKVREE